MAIYVVYQRNDEGTAIIAVVKGQKVLGPRQDEVRKMLMNAGWPDDPEMTPTRVFMGDYVYAVKEEEE